jgi:hypothetical protein
LHEFNELFGKQFVNGGGFPQQDFKKESNSAIKVTTEIFESIEDPSHEFINHFGTQLVNEGVFTPTICQRRAYFPYRKNREIRLFFVEIILKIKEISAFFEIVLLCS